MNRVTAPEIVAKIGDGVTATNKRYEALPSGRFVRLQTELDDLPTVLPRDPFLVLPEVARYVKLNDLRHSCPFCAFVCSLRVTLPFPAALTTDRIAKPYFSQERFADCT